MIVKAGQQFNFNYPTWDRATGLFVAATVYDVTSGTAVFVAQIAMIDVASLGIYEGLFTPLAGKSYLIISAVYTDGTYTVPDLTRGPVADQYDCFTTDTSLLNFNYGAFDQDASLTIEATVYDISTGTPVQVDQFNMTYVALGVYFGQYLGTVNKNYLVAVVPSDLDRAQSADSFQCFELSTGGGSVSTCSAELIGQSLNGVLKGQSLNATLEGDIC